MNRAKGCPAPRPA